MNLRPIGRYQVPRYPTLDEAQDDPKLLDRVPRRWLASAPFATLVGAGLLTKTLLAQSGDSATAQPAQVEAPRKPANPDGKTTRETVRQTKRVTTEVAPFLAEAMAQDGRGSYGCVAISPPVFLSENEALELIQTQLEHAGLKLQDKVQVDGVEAPLSTDPGATLDSLFRGKAKVGKRSYDFDLGDPGRSVVVEFFSLQDYRRWVGLSSSSVDSYDFPKLMERVAESFKKRKDGPPLVMGLFFDPLAHRPYRWRQPVEAKGLSEPLKAFAKEQELATAHQSHESLKKIAKEKLRKQVLHFIAYLRREGVLSDH